jgi:hypothetical protein
MCRKVNSFMPIKVKWFCLGIKLISKNSVYSSIVRLHIVIYNSVKKLLDFEGLFESKEQL